jgi:anti-sigma28 factor (negative regulator of flagellin synthesis)
MNHPNGSVGYGPVGYGSEGYKHDRRQSSGATHFAATGGITALAWGLPTATSRNTAAESIAEDPEKLCLAGRLISWATAGNEVRFEKVAALRQAIEAGKYNVSSADLADKLIDGLSR